MQIAEKYRKELWKYNEGTLNLPAYSQNGSNEDEKNPALGVEVPHLTTTSQDEVEVVKEANSVDELKKGAEGTIPRPGDSSDGEL